MYKFIVFFIISHVCFSQVELSHVVYFETDKYDITEIEKNRLLYFLKNLEVNNIKRISIYGFCDDRGTNNYNFILSQKRANFIKSFISSNNIKKEVISNVDGKGEILLRFIKSENIEIVRGLNRKVEILVEKKKINFDDLGRKLPLTLESNLIIGDKIILNNILFKTGYSYILEESIPVLEKIVNILKEKKELYFNIEGHVCCTTFGRDAIDRSTGKRNLSLARARYIYSYLIKKGIKKERMKYLGLKHKFPLGGDTKFDKRVEIEITDIKN